MTPAPFSTARLTVDVWSRLHPTNGEQVDDVLRILTPATTRYLPPGWSGSFDTARARRWIAEREESVLLATETMGGQSIGLVVMSDDIEIQLGYVIAEKFWGRGRATELVTALARNIPRTINAGVAAENAASISVLERAGFRREGITQHGDLLYRFEAR